MTELIAILMSLIAGEIRNIPPARDRRARDTRDSYVIVALDREEIFRTATAEKTLSPFFGEEFGFQVPREFRQLTFYVMVNDCLPLSRDLKLGRVAIDKEALVKGEAAEDKWYPVLPIDLDSEVQGKVHLSFSYREKLVDDGQTYYELSVKVVECSGLCGLGPSGLADPYAQVVILGPAGLRSEVRKGLVHRRSNDPQINETFKFPVSHVPSLHAVSTH
jgi:hypothetical protein